jgi:hypothetical protein
MIVQNGDRDLVGYGHHPPDPKWPRGARVALNFAETNETRVFVA